MTSDLLSSNAKVPYPKGVFFILLCEACEQFSYKGMMSMLVLFSSDVVLLSDTHSSVLFHGFSFLLYFNSIFGAILADSFIGELYIQTCICNINQELFQESIEPCCTCLWFMFLDMSSLSYPQQDLPQSQQRYCEYVLILRSLLITLLSV